MFHTRCVVLYLSLTLLAASLVAVDALRPVYRSFDGSNNSPSQVTLGAAATNFIRVVRPAATQPTSLPSSRLISNKLAEVPKRLNDAQLNLLQPFFAELIAHDLVSTKKDGSTRPIAIPRCDSIYDPPQSATFDQCDGNRTINFGLPEPQVNSTPKVFTNMRNSWLDLSWLYGLSQADNQQMRVGSGGRIFIDKFFNNSGKIVFDQTAWIRSGESPSVNLNPVFNSFFQLFARNHNYWAAQFARQLGATATDEILFQEARAMNIAEYQSIFSRQYLPATVGEPLKPYINDLGRSAYNASVDPSIDLFFASASFRYAHAEFRGFIPRLDAELKEIPQGGIALKTAFFNTLNHYIEDNEYGIINMTINGRSRRFGPAVLPLFRGLSHTLAGKVQPTLIDEMRNFVFSPIPTAPGIDLISVGIEMGRAQELGTYNDARRSFGLRPATTWSDVTSDVRLQQALASVYASVEDIDPWVGVLAEDTAPGAVVGPLARLSLLDQFTRIRNADRFWYENRALFSEEEIQTIHGVSLRTLFERIYPNQFNRTFDGREAVAGSQFESSAFFLPTRQLTQFGALESSRGLLFWPSTPVTVDRTLDLSPVYRLSWKSNWENNTITYILQGRINGWMGIGVGAEKNSMRGADIVLCRFIPLDNGTVDYTRHECRDSFALDVGPPVLDTEIGGSNDIQYSYASRNGDFQTFMFIKTVNSGDRWDKPITNNTEHGVIFAFHPTTYELRYHGPTRSSEYKIRFLDTTQSIRNEPIPAGVSTIVGVVSSLGLVLGVTLLIIVTVRPKFFRYQETLFCQLILVGTIIGYISSFVNLAPVATLATCIVNLWFIHLSYVFVVGCLFIKTWRMWRLLELSSLQVLKITRIDMLRLVGIYIVLESAILIAWTVVDPPSPRAMIIDVTTQVAAMGCQLNNDAWWFVTMGVKFVFMAFGTFLSIKNRDHAPIFNDSKAVGISTYVLFITMLIVGIVGIALRNFVAAVIIVKSLGIVIPYGIISIVLFGGTCLKIFRGQAPATSLTIVKTGRSSFASGTHNSSYSENSHNSKGEAGKSAPKTQHAPAPAAATKKPKQKPDDKAPRKTSAGQETEAPAEKKPKRKTSADSTSKSSRRESGPRSATSAKSAAKKPQTSSESSKESDSSSSSSSSSSSESDE